jgi:hypothetical protein
LLAGIALLAALACVVGVAAARVARVEFGPNDASYARGFREDWERDGGTRFRWTTPTAEVDLPFEVRGEGFKLRLRMRRHLIEPAHVRLIAEGRTLHAFDIAADPKVPYRIEEVPMPALAGDAPFRMSIQAPSENPRPLGIAMDWMEIERSGAGRFVPPWSMVLHLVAVALVASLVPRLAGAGRPLALAHAAVVILGAGLGSALQPIAAERILREGCWAYVVVGLATLLLLRWRPARDALEVAPPSLAGGLGVLVLTAAALRLAWLLHPQFYYPDVHVHGLFARELARRGLPSFLSDFTANQFRYSLGLQFERGHWYALPYPPLFYVFCWPLVRFAHTDPDVAVAIVAALVNSLEVVLVFAIARRLGAEPATALAASAAVPLLPLFMTRLSLGYFPALVGHAVDALAVLVLLAQRRALARPRVVALLAALVALALLTYTQSLVNFAILLPAFLMLQCGFDPRSWRRHLGLAVAGALGAVLSLGLFYARYVPVFLDMRRGLPMEGETQLLEKLERVERQRVAAEEAPADANEDPYTGSTIDPVRGLRKAVARLAIFYGPVFAAAIAAGFLLLIKRSEPEIARFLIAWGGSYVLLNLGSAGLPGPNLLRYNKDLEIVAPLCCLALATTGVWLWERARMLGIGYAAGYLWFGWTRAVRVLLERFALER